MVTSYGKILRKIRIDEGEILTLLQNHSKKINRGIRKKLSKGLPRVIEKMNSEEDL